jgi:hypothetical protein
VSSAYEQRARACVERALEGLDLEVALEYWDHPACPHAELAVVIRGKTSVGVVELHQRGHQAFGAEFEEDEPWPILSIETERADDEGGGGAPRREAS